MVFGYGLAAILTLVSVRVWRDHGYVPLAHNLLVSAALLLILCSVFDYTKLRPAYRIWMKGARGIGFVVSHLVLTLMFYMIFGIIGIALRIFKKDLLNRTIDPSAGTYWIRRKEKVFAQDHYLRQF